MRAVAATGRSKSWEQRDDHVLPSPASPLPVPITPSATACAGNVISVIEIVQEIVNRFDSHTESHEVTGHLVAGAGGADMGHAGRMLNEALHGAEALGQGEDAGPRAELDGSWFPTVHGDTDHSTEGPHLRPGDLMTRVFRGATDDAPVSLPHGR